MTAKQTFSVRHFTGCALITALFCLFGPIALPFGPIPISLTNFVLYLTVCAVGSKSARTGYLLYLLLGAVGLPVFSGYVGGLAKLAGPTGGYLIGFLVVPSLCAAVMRKTDFRPLLTALALLFANLIACLFGTVWFLVQMRCTVWYALSVCVFPFIPFDIIKIFLAVTLGKILRSALEKAHLLP